MGTIANRHGGPSVPVIGVATVVAVRTASVLMRRVVVLVLAAAGEGVKSIGVIVSASIASVGSRMNL